MNILEQLIKQGNVVGALDVLQKRLKSSDNPQTIHDELYPVAQTVLNPPFINPHIPKMHRICRELYNYLKPDEAGELLRVEVSEYARREKFKAPIKYGEFPPHTQGDLREAIMKRDRDEVANILAATGSCEGKVELSHRLLRLGSGYLDSSLGHSVSCTAFILLEYSERKREDEWPTYSVIADYFCKGEYSEEPVDMSVPDPNRIVEDNMLRAVSGTGIGALHDAITIYAIEMAKPITGDSIHSHLVGSWFNFLGDKKAEPFIGDSKPSGGETLDYSKFYELYSGREAEKLVSYASKMIVDLDDRRKLCHFLVKGLCDSYRGSYNPHFLTGLGMVLWVINRHWETPRIPETALYQYLDYLFS